MKEYDFYIVPTPIGNLGDITKRAIDILKTVDLIACEDMRVTQNLLNHFQIGTKCISYHKFNEKERVAKIVETLQSGKKMALVSDAGTPLFCDPGSILIKALKEQDFRITALPGANAAVTFLSQIPRDTEEFVFTGFLPKSEKQILEILNKYNHTNLVFYESPNRLLSTLEIIYKNSNEAVVSIGRELTKVFEEVITDKVINIIEHFKTNPLKGEIVAMVHAAQYKDNIEEYHNQIQILSTKGYSAKDISIIISSLYNINKNKVYSYLLNNNQDNTQG